MQQRTAGLDLAGEEHLGEKRLAGFLARNRYSGGRSVDELLDRLRTAPHGRAGNAELEARRAVVLALAAALKPLVEQIPLLTSQIVGALRAHDDGAIFLSLFRDPKSIYDPSRHGSLNRLTAAKG